MKKFSFFILILYCNIATYAQVSQYSRPRYYPPYESPYNLNLIKEVLRHKQQVLENNRSIIIEQLDKLDKALEYLASSNVSLTENDKDCKKAFEWYMKAAEKNNDVAYAIYYSNRRNTDIAKAYLQDVSRTIYTWCRVRPQKKKETVTHKTSSVSTGSKINKSSDLEIELTTKNVNVPIYDKPDGCIKAYVKDCVYLIKKGEGYSLVCKDGNVGYIQNIWIIK